MMDIVQNLRNIKDTLPDGVSLVAVSKTKPSSMVLDLVNAGQIDFGENKVQDLLEKQEQLPERIRWHMIGHLQSNKVKYIAPFVHMVHGVDSLKLLKVIEKEGRKNDRIIQCLLQVHIARESSKYGIDPEELENILGSEVFRDMSFVSVRGLMGMATFTDDSAIVREEFKNLKRIFEQVKNDHFNGASDFNILSMGMSDDYRIAIEEGSNMVRVGSLIFGPRRYS